MIHFHAVLLNGDLCIVGGITHDAAQCVRRVVDGRLHVRGVVVGIQRIIDPSRDAVFHTITQIGFEGFVCHIVVIHFRQLHPSSTREVNRVVADAQNLWHIGKVAVVVQVVLHHVQIHTVGVGGRIRIQGVQCVGHRTQRESVGREHVAVHGRYQRDLRTVPLHRVPAAGLVVPVADEEGNQTVVIARHCVFFTVNHRARVLAVGETHFHRHFGVVHQMVAAVSYHRLVADLVVAVALREGRRCKTDDEKDE